MKHHPKILAVVLSILLLLWNDIKNGKSRRAIPLFVVDATEEVILDHQGNLKSTPSKKGGGEDDALECGVWLAPSTLEGAGIGMFAGRDFDLGQEMIAGGDSIVPISDITEHNVGKIYPGNFLWQEYVWGVDAVNNREGLSEISTASPGFGSAANSNLPLQNVDMQFPKRTPNGLHRSSHAGAGASTIFHHRTSTARHAIATGDELYVSCTLYFVHMFV